MSATATITNQWSDGQRLHVTGLIVFAGSYPAGGDAVSWVSAADARQGFIGLATNNDPDVVPTIRGIAGYIYEYVKSTKKIQVKQGAAAINLPLADIPTAGYPGGVTGDTVDFYAIFKKF